jgi:RNA polymerase sigma-70 factor (ECF subfamily)
MHVSRGGKPIETAALADCVARARAAWPGVEVELEQFAEFVAARLDDGVDVEALARARAEDLWIACACTQGSAAAVRALDDRYAAMLHATVRSVVSDDDLASEAVQIVRARLLLPATEPPGPPRIASYLGRGDLGAWLRAAAVRQALDLVRKRGSDRPAGDAGLAAAAIEDDPELVFLKHTYRGEFRTAFDGAFAELDRRQRNLLRMKYLDNASIDVIARLHQVHRSTAARWVVEVREQLMAATRERMKAALGLPAGEFESVVRLIASQLDLSLEAKLRASPDE